MADTRLRRSLHRGSGTRSMLAEMFSSPDRNRPLSPGRNPGLAQLGASGAFISSPNIRRSMNKDSVGVAVRRCQSENFMHSWDYSPVPYTQSSERKRRKRRRRTTSVALQPVTGLPERLTREPLPRKGRSTRRTRKRSSTSSKISAPLCVSVERKTSFEFAPHASFSPRRQIPDSPTPIRARTLSHSHETKAYSAPIMADLSAGEEPPLTPSSEPEEQEIRDDLEDEDEEMPQHDAIFSQPIIDERSHNNHFKRCNSYSAISDALASTDRLSFDEHRDQFERLWQASQLAGERFREHSTVQFEQGDSGPTIVAGSLPHLINKLADESTQDNQYISDFLNTHLYFISTEKLLDCIFERYLMEKPPEERTPTNTQWEGPVRLRLVNVLKKWIEKYFCTLTPPCLEKLCTYVEGLIIPRQPTWGRFLQEAVRTRIRELGECRVMLRGEEVPIDFLADYVLRLSVNLFPRGTQSLKTTVFHETELLLVLSQIDGTTEKEAHHNMERLKATGYYRAPKRGYLVYGRDHSNQPEALISPTLKYNSPTDVMQVHAKEMARQLCLIEFDLFAKIKPCRDLVNVSSRKSAPVDSSRLYTNTLSLWVAGEIVQTANLRKRIAVLKRFIEIAEACWKMNNFSSATAILYGLDNPAVKRLKETWKGIPRKSLKTFTDLLDHATVANGFERLRSAMRTTVPPLVPYLPVFLRDISLLEMGNATIVPDTEDILNFVKFRMIAQHFDRIEFLQKHPYNFRRCSMMCRWLMSIPETSTEDLDRFSDLCEPRVQTTEEAPETVRSVRTSSGGTSHPLLTIPRNLKAQLKS